MSALQRLPAWIWSALVLGLLVLITGILQPNFLSAANLSQIVESNAPLGIVAVGMTLVILLGGIDLSVGSLLAFAGAVGILALNASGSFLVTAAVTVGVASLGGLLHGGLIGYGKIAPFIATLGTLVAFRSAAVLLADGGMVPAEENAIFRALGGGIAIPGTDIAPGPARVPYRIPYAGLAFIAVAVVGHVVITRTVFGRKLVAVGSNETAARFSGLHVERVKLMTYVLLGVCVGIGALLLASDFESINTANSGTLLELDAIAAVVIGGTRMTGGRGSVVGTVIGVLLLGVIRNVMVFLGIPDDARGLVTGAIIIAAVLVQKLSRE
ncbi:MAG: ABC transporter permease [Planctomycetota bacterium]